MLPALLEAPTLPNGSSYRIRPLEKLFSQRGDMDQNAVEDTNPPMSLRFKFVDSPVGRLKLVASDTGLVAVLWGEHDRDRVQLMNLVEGETDPILRLAELQLHEYFAGERQSFSVPLDMRGTDFQCQVWQALLRIPFGETRTYLQIAKELGDAKATRAVGAANGRNPLSIIAPCHRVIGASGKLTGFAGGLKTKAFLLRLEGYPDATSYELPF